MKYVHTGTDEPVDPEVERAKSNRSFLLTIAIIIGIIIIMGAIFYGIKFTTDKINEKRLQDSILDYNDYTFGKGEDGKWYTQIMIRNNTYIIPFYYNPKEAESVDITQINISQTIKDYYMTNRGGQIYITMNPNAQTTEIVVAGVELSRLLGNAYNIYNFKVNVAITEQYQNQTLDYPQVTCANATPKRMVIFIDVNSTYNRNEITKEGNCIILHAINESESIRVADAFSYRILQIME